MKYVLFKNLRMASFDELVNLSDDLTAAGIRNEIVSFLNCNNLQELVNGIGQNDIVVIVLNEDSSCKYLIIVQRD